MTSAVTPEGFEQYLDDALEPADWPGFSEEYQRVDMPELVEEKLEAWRVADEGGAAWAMRRRNRALDEIRKARALADEQHRQIEAYVQSIEAEHGRTVSYFEGKLREFYEKVWLGKRPGRGFTCKLPGGKLTSRAGGLKTEIVDVDKARRWLRAHAPECLTEPKPPEPIRDAIKAKFTLATMDRPGEWEVLPGVKLVRGERTFNIEEDAQ